MAERTDDLLKPTLADHEAREPQGVPWRLGSQLYVGFFGGALAVGGIAAVNAAMLGMPRRAIAAIVAVALAAEAALIAAFVAFGALEQARFASTVAGLLAFGGAFLIQRPADRVYHYHTREEEPYQSLFGAGLVACICARIVEAALVSGLGD